MVRISLKNIYANLPFVQDCLHNDIPAVPVLAHEYKDSLLHKLEQPSPLEVPRSSHSSEISEGRTYPFPQPGFT